ncbi:hypothetical protein ACX1C1_14385 [Paenibacillus sp. strain BS8-2]
MFITFAEYRILPANLDMYLAETKRLTEKFHGRVTLYEGCDQPGLFVEIWNASDEAEAENIKKERCDQRSPWAILTPLIQGGEAKLHVWTFKPALPSIRSSISLHRGSFENGEGE